MALRIATASDAPTLATKANAWAALRPDLYGTPNYTQAQALVDITSGRQRVFVYEIGTPAVMRGFIITNEVAYWDPDAQRDTMAIRIGGIFIDPAIFSTANLQAVMQALKQWGLNNRPLLKRLVGEITEPSPFFTYALAQGYRFLVALDLGDGTIQHTIDRLFTAATG